MFPFTTMPSLLGNSEREWYPFKPPFRPTISSTIFHDSDYDFKHGVTFYKQFGSDSSDMKKVLTSKCFDDFRKCLVRAAEKKRGGLHMQVHTTDYLSVYSALIHGCPASPVKILLEIFFCIHTHNNFLIWPRRPKTSEKVCLFVM